MPAIHKAHFFVKPKNVMRKVCVTLDACHMLKLAYNTLADKRTIVSNQGIIGCKSIKSTNNLQKEQSLKFANKLSENHIFKKKKSKNKSENVTNIKGLIPLSLFEY